MHTESHTQRKKHKERHRHKEADTELREGGTDTHVEARSQRKTGMCGYTETYTSRCTEQGTREQQ